MRGYDPAVVRLGGSVLKKIAFGFVVLLIAALATWLAWNRDIAVPLAIVPAAPAKDDVASQPAAASNESTVAAETSSAVTARTAVATDAPRDWIARGRVLSGPERPYAGARIEARCIAGYDPEVEPIAIEEITCDEQGRFAWPIVQPETGVTLRFAGKMPKHGGSDETIRVPAGDPAPQDVELYAYPLDVEVSGVVAGGAGEPLRDAWVRTSSARFPCGAEGGYRVDVTKAFGSSQLSAGAPGHVTERRTLSAEDATEHVDFRLRTAFQITGRVVDERSAPVADATVMTFYSLHDPSHCDRDGRFVVDGLDPDRQEHSLVARAPGYVEATERVDVREPTREHELILRRGARVSGRVFGPEGSPVACADLYIGFSPNAWNRLDAVSSDDGSFAFPAVGSGAQTLVTQRRGLAADQRVLQIDENARDLEVVVRLGVGHFVAGVVVDEADAPVQGVPIAVRVTSPASPRGEYIDVQGRSGDDGMFRLDGLPDGKVTLELYGTGWVRAEVADIAVDRQDVRIKLKRAARIGGRVVDAESGQPLTDFRVRIVRFGAGIAATWTREGHSFHNPDGLWDTRGEQLEAGTKWGVEATADGYAPARALDVIASVDPVPDACVLRMRRGGTVVGVVVAKGTGEPVAGATISWFSDEQDLQRARHEPYGLIRSKTDAAGAFELVNVPPGPTTLAVEATGMPRHVEGPFELQSGGLMRMQIELSTGARIRGVVADIDGHGGAAVLHLSPRQVTGAEPQKTEAAADGTFAFGALLAGEYELWGYLTHERATTPVARVVTLTTDEDLELRLGPEGSATVRGAVTGDGPIADGDSVMLMPKGSDAKSRRAWRGVVFAGRFELRGLPAGEYRLLVSSSAGAMGSVEVTVIEGSSSNVDVTVVQRRR